VKQSEDPVPSAKAASADAQISSVAIKPFSPLANHTPLSGSKSSIHIKTYLLYVSYVVREKYTYFFCFKGRLKNRFAPRNSVFRRKRSVTADITPFCRAGYLPLQTTNV
jgi:hypothetical protein